MTLSLQNHVLLPQRIKDHLTYLLGCVNTRNDPIEVAFVDHLLQVLADGQWHYSQYLFGLANGFLTSSQSLLGTGDGQHMKLLFVLTLDDYKTANAKAQEMKEPKSDA